MHRLILVLLLAAAGGPLLRAQGAPAENVRAPQDSRSIFSHIRGLFDFDLPNIDPPGTVKMVLHPHLGDFVRRDYMRVDTGLVWAVNDRLEINPEALVYFTHGLGGSSQDGYGIGLLRLDAKQVSRAWPTPNYETSAFFNFAAPVGHPPVDMTDGLNHYAPGFLVQHHSTRNPRLTTFAGAGFDFVSDSTIAGTPVRNQPLDDSVNFTAGAIYDLGQVKWTLTTTYATTAVIGARTDNFIYVRPSLLWNVPGRFTFHSKTRWMVGLGARISWGPDGSEVSISNSVRAEITFRQVLDNMRPLLPKKPVWR